jgi:uncharacterized protein
VDLRVSRASAVVVQRVPAASADWFMDWQRGASKAAEGFAGYSGTDVYPPANGRGDQWVVVIHYDDDESLQTWLRSPVRAEWVAKLQGAIGDFDLKAFPGGFGAWFTDPARQAGGDAPESWKMALTVLLALYPTVMLLTIFVGPYTNPAGMAVSMLIGNMMSISILQWGVMPVLTKLLGPWLGASTRRATAPSLAGLGLVLVLLAAITFAFRLKTG